MFQWGTKYGTSRQHQEKMSMVSEKRVREIIYESVRDEVVVRNTNDCESRSSLNRNDCTNLRASDLTGQDLRRPEECGGSSGWHNPTVECKYHLHDQLHTPPSTANHYFPSCPLILSVYSFYSTPPPPCPPTPSSAFSLSHFWEHLMEYMEKNRNTTRWLGCGPHMGV